MILIDTSAFYALADRRDPAHPAARSILAVLQAGSSELLLTSYVLVETFSLLHRRLGLEAAVEVSESTRSLEHVLVDRRLHDLGVDRLSTLPRRVSLVDAVSFAVMEERGIETAFAFDPDFERAGFRLCGEP